MATNEFYDEDRHEELRLEWNGPDYSAKADRFDIIPGNPMRYKPFGGGLSKGPRTVEVFYADKSVGTISTLMDNFELTQYFSPLEILRRVALETLTDTDVEILDLIATSTPNEILQGVPNASA